jgi:hypothetical protein
MAPGLNASFSRPPAGAMAGRQIGNLIATQNRSAVWAHHLPFFSSTGRVRAYNAIRRNIYTSSNPSLVNPPLTGRA